MRVFKYIRIWSVCIYNFQGKTPKIGLSQLSKSSDFLSSPVTLKAFSKNRYDPSGIVVPLAKIGSKSGSVFQPPSSAD